MDTSFIKQMPISIDAERALLGSIIIKPETLDTVGGYIVPEDFYDSDHRIVYTSLLSMYMQNKTIDSVTLVNDIKAQGGKDEASSIEFISLLAQSVPTAANAKDYAKIVKEKSTLRKLINVCDSITEDAYEEGADVHKVIDGAEQKIFDISHERDSKEFRHIRSILSNVYHDIENRVETKGAVTGSKTGFSELDSYLIEMGKGDLIIVGARPGMGKTSFALNIATNVAKASKKTVAIFSLEMSGEQLVTRIISSEALVDSHSIRTGQLKPEDWENIAGVVTTLSGCDIYIDDTSAINATEMKSKLRRLSNLGLVVIDYIGLMQSTVNTDNRAQQVGEISRNLKIMAKDFGVPIVCCAQLNRATESRTGSSGGKRPTLSDLRDSGSIEQDADIVLFLYRDEYYKSLGQGDDDDAADIADAANTAEIIVAKNRHGSTGNIKMGWIGQFTKFRTLEKSIPNG